jgi:hypothetical protein
MVTNEEDVPRFSLRRGARFLETFPQEPESEDSDEQWIADLRQDPGEGSTPDAAGDLPSDAAHGESVQEVIELPSEAADLLHGVEVHTEVENDPELPVLPQAELLGELEPPAEASTGPDDSGRATAGRATGSAAPSRAGQQSSTEPVPGLNLAMATLAEHLAGLEEALARTTAACIVARTVLGQGQALRDHPPETPGAPASGDRSAGNERGDQAPLSPESAVTAGPGPRTHRHSAETPALSRLIHPFRRYGP